MITEIEQSTLDIDWFFTNGKEIGFVASAGGKLPKSVSKSKENLEILSSYFRNLPWRCDAIINPELKKIVPDRIINERYLSDFIQMTEKGLYSFDKSILNSFSNTNYHIITSPGYPLKVHELPSEIMEILIKTKTEGDIKIKLNNGSFDT